jgi:Ran GTPase-activating protein (RanGAP) involved in mRNA processing and transport
MFRSMIAWLNKRFPEVLTVTRQDYTELRQEVASYNVLHQNQGQMVEKLISLEKRIKTLENAQGFINNGKGSFTLER